MYRLYGIPTQNTLKCAYVLDAVGVDYEFQMMDLKNGEHKKEAYLKINPIGKVPALKHNDFCLFESGAICRYVANVEDSPLYPQNKMLRAQTDQWLDYFSAHVGRWFSTLFFQRVIKKVMGLGEADTAQCDEALNFISQQIPPVEAHLGRSPYFVGDAVSIADLVAFAYLEQAQAIHYDLTKYPNLTKWMATMEKLPSVQKTKGKVKLG